jgi:ribosomal protein S18 acetylase RimI-like enzyme
MPAIEKKIHARAGDVVLVRGLTAEYLSSLKMGEGLGVFFHYRDEEADKTRAMLSSVCESAGGTLACALRGNQVIGYVAVVEPEAGSRWETINDALLGSAPGLENPVLLELGSIEVSTPWRSMGIARELMRFMFEDPAFRRKIVFSRELSWHWDLKSSGLSPYAYRSMLLRLFESADFRYHRTDDEEIGYAGENMLTARIGEDIPDQTAFLFYRSLSRREPRGWGWG